jgi:hypothetical protein
MIVIIIFIKCLDEYGECHEKLSALPTAAPIGSYYFVVSLPK